MSKDTRLRTTLVAAAVAGVFASLPGYARDQSDVMHGGVNTPTPGGNNVVGQEPYGPPGGALGNPPGAPFATEDREREMRRRHDEMMGGTAGTAGMGQTGTDKVYPGDRPGISPAQRGVKTPSYGGDARTPEPAPNAGPSVSVEPRAIPTPGGNNVVGQLPYNEPGGAVANPPGAPFATQDRAARMEREREAVGGTTGGTASGQSRDPVYAGDRPGISPAQRGIETPSYGGNARTPEPATTAGPSVPVQPRAVPTPGGNNVVGQNPYGPPGGAVANPPGAPFYQGGTAGGTAAGTSGSAGNVDTPTAGGNNVGHGVNKQ